MLGVLSSKRLTFQAQHLWFYLPKVQLSKLNTWCFIFQKLNIPSSTLGVLSSKNPTFQAQCLMFYLSKVQRSKLKSPMFQAPKAQILSLDACRLTLFFYSFTLFSFSFSVLFHPFLSAHRWLVPVHGSVYRGSLDAPFHPVRGCYHGSVGLFPD